MTLYEIRQLLNDYHKKIHFQSYHRIEQLRHYLHQFAGEADEYELTAKDVLDLMKAIPKLVGDNKDLPPIDKLKQSLDTHFLFWIYSVLNDAGLIDEAAFTEIYNLPPEGRQQLVYFLCEFPPQSDLLLGILTFAAKKTNLSEKIESCLRFFQERKQLAFAALALLASKAHEAHCLLKTLNALDSLNCLNEAAFESLTARDSLYQVDEMLDLIRQLNIPATRELVDAIAASSSLNYLVEILPVVLASGKVTLTQSMLIGLLNKDFKFFFVRRSVLMRLGQYDLLNNQTWHYVLKHDVFLVKQILDILAAASLAKGSEALLNRIMSKTIDGYDLVQSLGYLQKAGVLNQQSLESCLQLLPKSPAVSPKKDLLHVFHQLDEAGFMITEPQLTLLFSLSSANIRRLHNRVVNLIHNKQLNPHSFAEALQRTSEKLPPVKEVVADKKSRKVSGAARSQVCVNNGHSFFTSHDKHYDEGGFGKVKKGFPSADAPEPVYSIKKLYEKDKGTAQREGIREVKHHHLLGRQAFYYTLKGITYIVAEWQKGKGLHCYSVDELKKIHMKNRLACLRDGLAQLNTLHEHARVHGDIKEQNFILDFNASSMKLIDFGGSHRQASEKPFAYTPAYADPRISGDHYGRDMYAMGIVAMQLFPELYTVSVDALTTRFKANKVRPTVIEQAVLFLIAAMMRSDFDKRCTSEAALSYCDKLLKAAVLDRNVLEEIKNATITRPNKTVEDVLRM
ncbi:protein kinase domain-containing protein [Legionella erythra]|uniref:Protein kinase domain protein n=1 Tax=Legionella erythra TaxID=448 RepID=A0A0W0TKQ1_LEGER|nr:protein kinase [Legionella erythra]KTC96163.1 Protein kinase domain protein [Legionella erythra]